MTRYCHMTTSNDTFSKNHMYLYISEPQHYRDVELSWFFLNIITLAYPDISPCFNLSLKSFWKTRGIGSRACPWSSLSPNIIAEL